MNVVRMKMLADYLRTIPEERFNMREYWREVEGCGCTIGHAAHMPEFKLLGFNWDLIPDHAPAEELPLEFQAAYGNWLEPPQLFKAFMDLTEDQCRSIAAGYLFATPEVIADRIEIMIEKDERKLRAGDNETCRKETTPSAA